MGRIKTVPIKRITQKTFKKHKDKFSSDYEKNKETVSELLDTDSKKIRNTVAGYVTRLAKANKE